MWAVHLLDIHGSAPEVLRDGVAEIGRLHRCRIHELPRRHLLEHRNVVVPIGWEQSKKSKKCSGVLEI